MKNMATGMLKKGLQPRVVKGLGTRQVSRSHSRESGYTRLGRGYYLQVLKLII